ncbi:hypothetical protein B0H10DRAFT_1938664 [Mycena sp. CBHHK59/15]|nr:hypothetical protein B0H10DRAFT_1938664 [Mycena sp. CBHHK59/15]
MSGHLRRPFGFLTMGELNLGSLSHLDIQVRVLGGARNGKFNSNSLERCTYTILGSSSAGEHSNQEGPAAGSSKDPNNTSEEHPKHNHDRSAAMQAAMEFKLQDNDGNPLPVKLKHPPQPRHPQNKGVDSDPHGKGKAKAKPKKLKTVSEASSDSEDRNFVASGTDSGSSSSDYNTIKNVDKEKQISNEELVDSLLSKTVLDRFGGSRCKQKAITTTEKPPKKKRNCRTSSSDPTISFAIPSARSSSSIPVTQTSTQPQAPRRNPVYLFHKQVNLNSAGEPGKNGDKHYQCLHGNHKVITVTKAMKYSVNGLVGYLKSHAELMHHLYQILYAQSQENEKETGRSNQPTEKEIKITSGNCVFDDVAEQSYMAKLRKGLPSTIGEAFEQQKVKLAVCYRS